MRAISCWLLLLSVWGPASAQAPQHAMTPTQPVWKPVGPNLLPGAEIACYKATRQRRSYSRSG
jgi:hypothetical protein